jgi:RNA polymerase sigma-70 factor (ECF subfamily)
MQDDRDILQTFQKDPQSGFRMLVMKYQEKLYYHIRRMLILHADTDDVLQNTLVKAWKGLPGFKENSQLYTWLYRIATNEALAFLKEKNKKKALSYTQLDSVFLNTVEGDYFFNGDELQKALLEIVAALPEKQQLVFQLKYFDEMTYEDMSEVLKTSVGALKASYHHAVRKIKEKLEDR